MSGKGKIILIAFVAVALCSALGLYRLFTLRFEKGDIFPPYSSLRSDPLGCKALYKALENCGLSVRRNFRDHEKLKGEREETIYWLGVNEATVCNGPEKEVKGLEALARAGNRVVVSLGQEEKRASRRWEKKCSGPDCAKDKASGAPKGKSPGDSKGMPSRDSKATPASAPKATPPGAIGANTPVDTGAKPSIDNRAKPTVDNRAKPVGAPKVKTPAAPAAAPRGGWGMEVGIFDLPEQKGKVPRAALAAPAFELPATITLGSRRYLEGFGSEWQPVYQYAGHAVVLERRIGKGTVVLMADPYLFSNQAMRNDRTPGLISWLQGVHRVAIFDEAHLGVMESPGIMALVKKHRLVPLLLALLAVAFMYVWKNAVPFAGVAAVESGSVEGEKRDHFNGLVNLLRRNIPPGEVMSTCFREWRKTFSRELKHQPELAGELQKVLDEEKGRPSLKRDPVAVYKRMTAVLAFFRMK